MFDLFCLTWLRPVADSGWSSVATGGWQAAQPVSISFTCGLPACRAPQLQLLCPPLQSRCTSCLKITLFPKNKAQLLSSCSHPCCPLATLPAGSPPPAGMLHGPPDGFPGHPMAWVGPDGCLMGPPHMGYYYMVPPMAPPPGMQVRFRARWKSQRVLWRRRLLRCKLLLAAARLAAGT